MVATSVGVRPCRERWKPSSSGRSTRTVPSSRTIRISGWNVSSSVPRGPFTVTCDPSTVTSTPLGISMGCFPILLMTPSPNVCQHFAAEALSRGLAVGHQSLGGGEDGDPQPSQDARERVTLRVDAPARLRDAPEPADRALAVLAVLQRDLERGE